ncbi:hypothetical protein IAI10_05675 [Clostridium sp. 19966]|uniref:DUF7743 domain-containing protein n=1 Tax=Clostridium sp. 19966 TaxID=2768166 RepID=UPI0028E07C18|nr:dockerin type I domain-containing protein [Clostridium sp. 19966]MDT8716137.1 hypothetical protein [Clostridium sp. 19966]
MKKISYLCVVVLLFNLMFLNKITVNADSSSLVIRSITVDKNQATGGDDVKISIDAADSKDGIKYIEIYYAAPSGKTIKKVVANPSDGMYEGTIHVNNYDEAGKNSIQYILVCSNNNGITDIINNQVNHNPNPRTQDFSSGDFMVYGTKEDTEAPKIESISVDKAIATVGETVKVSAKVTDDSSGVNTVRIRYEAENGDRCYEGYMKLVNGVYEMDIKIGQYDDNGMMKPYSIEVCDNLNNKRTVYNSNIFTSTKYETQDFSSGDYTVIRSVDVNGDGTIDGKDLAQISQHYNLKSTDSNWDNKYDINGDNIVDVFDITLLSKKIN